MIKIQRNKPKKFSLTFVLMVYKVLIRRYWTIFNHFRIVKCVLLDSSKSEMNQIYLIDNLAGYFAPLTFLKIHLHLIKRWTFWICLLSAVNESFCFNIVKRRLCKYSPRNLYEFQFTFHNILIKPALPLYFNSRCN